MEHPENETKASTTEDSILTVTLLSFQQCIPEFQTACYAGVTTHRSEHPVYPDEWWLSGKDLYLDNAAAAGFVLNNGPVVIGDVLATKIHSTVVNHTSVYLGDNKVYHHLGYRKSVIEKLKPIILNNLDSVWRHKDII